MFYSRTWYTHLAHCIYQLLLNFSVIFRRLYGYTSCCHLSLSSHGVATGTLRRVGDRERFFQAHMLMALVVTVVMDSAMLELSLR